MASNDNKIRVQKRLLQFNQIPFAFGEVNNPSYTATFKGEVQNYTNAAHGGYYPSLNDWGKLQTSSFSADLSFDFTDIECEDKIRYFRFIKRQLSKSGKLFATQGGTEIIWTNARVVSINEIVDAPNEKDMFRLNVTFELIDGYWRIATRTRAFLCEYCPARFKDFDPTYCFDATDFVGACDETGTSKCIPCEMNLYEPPTYEGCDWKPLCNFSKKEIESMFGVNCANRWAINYSCELENNFFCFDVPWGKKFRLRADSNYNTTHISLCSKTDFPTEFVRIRLSGEFYNPKIYFVKDYSLYTPVIPDGSPVALDLYEKTNAGAYVKTTDKWRNKGKTYYEYTPDDPTYEVIDYVVPKDDARVNINGVMTIGFGPEIYSTDNPRSGEKNQDGSEATEISTMFSRSNTPYFQVMPGMNDIVVVGNQKGSDAFIYVEPVEVTW